MDFNPGTDRARICLSFDSSHINYDYWKKEIQWKVKNCFLVCLEFIVNESTMIYSSLEVLSQFYTSFIISLKSNYFL